MGAIRASLGPVGLAGAKLLGFEVPMRQYEHERICSRTAFGLHFCFVLRDCSREVDSVSQVIPSSQNGRP